MAAGVFSAFAAMQHISSTLAVPDTTLTQLTHHNPARLLAY